MANPGLYFIYSMLQAFCIQVLHVPSHAVKYLLSVSKNEPVQTSTFEFFSLHNLQHCDMPDVAGGHSSLLNLMRDNDIQTYSPDS